MIIEGGHSIQRKEQSPWQKAFQILQAICGLRVTRHMQLDASKLRVYNDAEEKKVLFSTPICMLKDEETAETWKERRTKLLDPSERMQHCSEQWNQQKPGYAAPPPPIQVIVWTNVPDIASCTDTFSDNGYQKVPTRLTLSPHWWSRHLNLKSLHHVGKQRAPKPATLAGSLRSPARFSRLGRWCRSAHKSLLEG